MASSSVFRDAEVGAKLVSANAKFASDLYRQIAQSASQDNLFFSPASVSIALAMTYLGAKGNTSEQMRKVMQFGDISDEHLHSAFEDVQKQLLTHDDKCKLLMANRLFAEKTYNFLDGFLGKTKHHYQAELAPVDFKFKFEESREHINKWVESQTAEKITGLLPQGSLDTLTRLVLVNAIYFKGLWHNQFRPSATKEGIFHVNSKEDVKVQYMYQRETMKYGYRRDINAIILELPYVDKKLSMFFLLPEFVEGINEVEAKLSCEHLTNVEEAFSMRSMMTELTLPRFKVELTSGLGEILQKMGMEELFVEGKADLSGMDGTKDLFVSKVVHKAYIDVNEEGTEAAAATGVVIQTRSMPQVFEFPADHPFLFFIRDNVTGTILFLGRVRNPVA